jgi:1,4-dihydroxy-2-naphthoate octaprenyltransferase
MATVDPALDGLRGWRAWAVAARPRTLPVAAAPVTVGTALAWADGRARALPAAAALLAALLIQIGTNLANDLFDWKKGADTAERIGPPRVTQLGILAPTQMRRGTVAVFAAAAAVGLYLVAVGGWPIALVGALSIAAGVAYSGGPFPFGYHGLGDAAVFLFFGAVAVGGTYYVQALALPPLVLAVSLPLGALATAILVVNNIRDVDTDRKAGKRTLAVRLGRRAARIEYAALLLVAYALLPAFWIGGAASLAVLLPALTFPRAAALIRTVATSTDGPTLNAALAGTARLELGFALLLAAGWLA